MRIVTRSGITHVSNPGGSLQELLKGRSELRLSIQFLVRGGARNRRSTTQIGDERRSSCESVLLSGAHGAAAAHVIPLLPPLPSVAARAILRMRNPYQTGGGESRTVDAADSPQSTTGQTATHRGGWIDPRVVPNRVRGLKDANASIDHYDAIQCLLRLSPEHRTVALEMAGDMEGEFGCAFRYALGGEADASASQAALWIAASRCRNAQGTDTFLEDRGWSGPDLSRPASYLVGPEHLRRSVPDAFGFERGQTFFLGINGEL